MPKLPNRKLHRAQITAACTSTASIFIWKAILFAKTFPEITKLKPSLQQRRLVVSTTSTSSSALCAAGAAGCCCCSVDPPGVAAAADAAAPEPPAPPPGSAADGELPGETNLYMVVWSPPLCGCVGCAVRLCVSLRSLRQPEYMGFRCFFRRMRGSS